MRKLIVLPTLLALVACDVVPLTEYRPVVDPGRTDMAKFESDLQECRAVAVQVEADYQQRQQEQMGANLLAGLLMGAVVGAAVGGGSRDMAAYGAATGAAAGVATNDYGHDLVRFGPRRVVDRCMTDRGHSVLNDIGRG